MNRKKFMMALVVLALIAGTAGLLANLRAHQKLGLPAVKTSPLDDPIRVRVELPERVLDYESTNVPIEKIVVDTLPKDTSFGQRLYIAPDNFKALVSVVLMGKDRSSMHKPQICFEGQGWIINDNVSTETTVPMEQPCVYNLPVMKLIANKVYLDNGEPRLARQVYVYWFVAPNEITAKHWQRMWWLARDLFSTGVLQRWAYVSFSSLSAPGQEDATFKRMSKLIAATVPEFQVTPQPAGSMSTAQNH
jgi:hypothetical protein